MEKKDDQILVEYSQAGNSPFMIVKGPVGPDDETMYFVVAGKLRISDYFKTEDAAIKDAESITWAKISALLEMYKIGKNEQEIKD